MPVNKVYSWKMKFVQDSEPGQENAGFLEQTQMLYPSGFPFKIQHILEPVKYVCVSILPITFQWLTSIKLSCVSPTRFCSILNVLFYMWSVVELPGFYTTYALGQNPLLLYVREIRKN